MDIGNNIKKELSHLNYTFEERVEESSDGVGFKIDIRAHGILKVFVMNRVENIPWDCNTSVRKFVHKKAVSALGRKLPQPL